MPQPTVRGVHLVGSVPLPTTEETFRTVSKALNSHLRRLPDGEPGERDYYVLWQLGLFKKEPRVLGQAFNPEALTSVSEQEADEVMKNIQPLETRYDEYALSSYETFKALKKEGVIPSEV